MGLFFCCPDRKGLGVFLGGNDSFLFHSKGFAQSPAPGFFSGDTGVINCLLDIRWLRGKNRQRDSRQMSSETLFKSLLNQITLR